MKAYVTVGVVSLVTAAGVFTPGVASATRGSQDNNHKVTICHRTNSVKNPYVKITVDHSAVDGKKHDDHSRHTGPVGTSEAELQKLKDAKTKWGDIIPPVAGVTAGRNWASAGQAIYNNGCVYKPAQSTNPTTDEGEKPEGQVLGETDTQQQTFPEILPKTGISAVASSVLASIVAVATGALHYLTRRPKQQ